MIQLKGEAGLDQGNSGGDSETETVDGMDIGYRRERSNDKIQNFWLEHRDRVAVCELGKIRGE